MNAPNYPDTMSAPDTAETQPQRPPFRYLFWYRYLPAVVVMLLILLVSYALPSNHYAGLGLFGLSLCVLGASAYGRLAAEGPAARLRRFRRVERLTSDRGEKP